MLLESLRAGLAAALVGCSGHRPESDEDTRVRTTPKSTRQDHFDQLLPNESLVGKEFFLTARVNGVKKDVRVRLNTLFEWEVGEADFSIARLSASGQTARPGEPIPTIGTTIDECVERCVVAENNTGVDIHTSIGTAHIPLEEIHTVIGALSQLGPEFSGEYSGYVDIEAMPNDKGQLLLTVGKGLSFVGLSSEDAVNIPDTVNITFRKTAHAPLPVAEAKPEPTTGVRLSALLNKLGTTP